MMNPPGALALFVFGTLMDPDIFQLVTRQSIDTLQLDRATVNDHARRWVIDDQYPVLIQRAGHRAEGLIIRGLAQESMNRIAFYEGEEFTLKPLMVERADSQSEQVQFFAYNHRQLVSDEDWSLVEWQRTTKAETLPRAERFMRHYGVLSLTEANDLW